jgi:lysophospholipase
MRQFLEPPIQGVVLQTYGAGNLPTNRPDLTEELRQATERGVLIVNCTQCAKGSVHYAYESATELQKIGVCSGSDMTIEAALMKVNEINVFVFLNKNKVCFLVIICSWETFIRYKTNENEND